MSQRYRTHTCGELTLAEVDKPVRLAGWIYRKRDFGGLLFIDLRDHHGVTQIVLEHTAPGFPVADGARLETVITCTGRVRARTPETINPNLPTGTVEVYCDDVEVL